MMDVKWDGTGYDNLHFIVYETCTVYVRTNYTLFLQFAKLDFLLCLCMKYIGITLFTNVFQTCTYTHPDYCIVDFFWGGGVISELNLLFPIKWISPNFHIWKRKIYFNRTYINSNLHVKPHNSYYVEGSVVN